MNNTTLTLTSQVLLPEGEGPFPAIIGMAFFPGSGGTGSLPADIFTSRDIARIEFVHDQVTSYGSQQTTDPYYQLYPELNATNTGQYSAWAWGVSRLIDGLELVQDNLAIDLEHIAVTGCSYAGKMALFAGAFDERIALTIAQESGGGGAPAWRVSETLGDVERLHSTDHNWFKESMFDFGYSNVTKLPMDHHELMAMCAPRALLVTANTDYKWLANPSCYVSARATHKVYGTFGIKERFGFFIDGGHGHCSIPDSQRPAIEAFVDRFMLGDTTANTNITVHPDEYIDHSRWYKWWGTGNPVLPGEPSDSSQIYYFEPECAEVGGNWNIVPNARTSGGYYVSVKPDTESVSTPPTDSRDHIIITFSVESDTTFYIFGLMDCPTEDDDSYWLKMDNGTFIMADGLGTNGWEWKQMTSYALTSGEHTLIIAYRENGIKLDKICISDFSESPERLGGPADNACDLTSIDKEDKYPNEYKLGQNYPNPFNPKTIINYELPITNYVELSIYNVLGEKVKSLVSQKQQAGMYAIEWDASGYASGIYYYKIDAGDFSEIKKMILVK
jgi:hypothetical protein